MLLTSTMYIIVIIEWHVEMNNTHNYLPVQKRQQGRGGGEVKRWGREYVSKDYPRERTMCLWGFRGRFLREFRGITEGDQDSNGDNLEVNSRKVGAR